MDNIRRIESDSEFEGRIRPQELEQFSGQEKIVSDLKECAAIINNIEGRMIEIRKEIETASDTLSEDEILYQKLSRLDINV